MSSLFRRCAGAGGVANMVARRDSPEIILPDSATPGIKALGAADTLTGVWAEICSAAEFGASPLTLVAAALSFRVGATLAVNAALNVARQGRVRLASGAAGAEARIAEYRFAGNCFAQLIVVAPADTAIVVASNCNLYPVGPLALPASTRISYDGAENDAAGNHQSLSHLLAYDTATWTLQDLGFTAADFLAGLVAVDTVVTDYVAMTSGAAAWANGAYATMPIKGGATADADYLVTDVYVQNTGAIAAHRNVDLARGAAGVEVIQSRWAGGSVASWYGPSAFRFPIPFILLSGERLSARMRQSNGADTANVTCTMVQLP